MEREHLRNLVIINKHAGKNESYRRVTDQLEKLSLENPEVKYTSCRSDAIRIAREFVSGCDDFVRIFACGGDGTVNEVLSGVYDLKNCAVAVVPIGSGNDFIRSFGFSKEDFLDLNNLANGTETKVDLLKCGDYISCNSITIGYDCAVAKNVARFKNRRFITASLAYKLSIFYCLLKGRKHNFKIKTDGHTIENPGTYLLSVSAKGKYYGGGIKCSPQADNSDGLIDFMSIPTVGVIKFVSLLPTFIKGDHIDNPKLGFVTHKKCATVEYISDTPVEIGIDGEIVQTKYAKITVLPEAARIILPKRTSGSR
jgi:YegS/Rv2252/BmrU family lipid kinase